MENLRIDYMIDISEDNDQHIYIYPQEGNLYKVVIMMSVWNMDLLEYARQLALRKIRDYMRKGGTLTDIEMPDPERDRDRWTTIKGWRVLVKNGYVTCGVDRNGSALYPYRQDYRTGKWVQMDKVRLATLRNPNWKMAPADAEDTPPTDTDTTE